MLRVFTDERCLAHEGPPGFPETSARLSGLLGHLRGLGCDIVDGEAPSGVEDLVAAVHTPAYVARFRRASERGDGLLDSADNPLRSGTWEAAWAAARVAVAAADWVARGSDRVGFAAIRPPGHHAERDRAMGFCYFNNAALAVERLRREHGCTRVAVYDLDVHHGNGTQHLFEERADVFYASTHQSPFYPGTGAASERGRGPGLGATLNVPLARGTGDEEVLAAFADRIAPALGAFAPEVLVVSAGFDAWRGDPLGGLAWSEDVYEELGRRLAALASASGRGRVAVLLEGGYDLAGLPRLAERLLRGLSPAVS
jgi:acetoin utilization deacetylase AcuC-like enzyme